MGIVSHGPRVACAPGIFYIFQMESDLKEEKTVENNRIIFFVDGFNLYHSIADNPGFQKYKWLDIEKLCKNFVKREDIVKDIYYFTSLTMWNSAKVKRHKTYINALELKDIKVVYGEFRLKEKTCRLCRKTYETFEEKQTDVNIAIHLFSLALQDKYDTAIIVSGDSDLAPAIKSVKENFPSKDIGIVIPFGRRSKLLRKISYPCFKIKERHLKTSLLPYVIGLDNGKILHCPSQWR